MTGPTWDRATVEALYGSHYRLTVSTAQLGAIVSEELALKEAKWGLIKTAKAKFGVVMAEQDCVAKVFTPTAEQDPELAAADLSVVVAKWRPSVDRAQMVGGPRDGELWQVSPGTTRIRFHQYSPAPFTMESDVTSPPRPLADTYSIERGGWSPASRAWLYDWDERKLEEPL